MVREIGQDVLVVGAGVIGLAIARELTRRGVKRVTVIDRGIAGNEASYAAGGMLAVQAETDEANAFFDLCRASRDAYPDFAAELESETGIDIELDRAGTLYLAFNESDSREIRHRFDWQRSAGLNVELLPAVEIRRIEPFVSPDVREGLIFPDDWQVENRRLIAALTRSLSLAGVSLIENCECERLIEKNGRIIGVETAAGKLYAHRTILAAGAWTSLIGGDGIECPVVKPIRGQIFGFQTAKRLFSRVIYSPRGYIIPRSDGRIIAGATVEDAGFEKGITAAGEDFVCRSAFEISPSLSGLTVSERISGLRPKAADGLPVIGRFPQVENLFIATAHYRNGILLAPITARLMADLLIDGMEPDGFGPERFETRRS